MCLGNGGMFVSITGYCCCCLFRWVRPCSCGPSTGPRCWQHRAAAASFRWCGPDLWPPQNCWSDAAGRSLGWLQTHTHTMLKIRKGWVLWIQHFDQNDLNFNVNIHPFDLCMSLFKCYSSHFFVCFFAFEAPYTVLWTCFQTNSVQNSV